MCSGGGSSRLVTQRGLVPWSTPLGYHTWQVALYHVLTLSSVQRWLLTQPFLSLWAFLKSWLGIQSFVCSIESPAVIELEESSHTHVTHTHTHTGWMLPCLPYTAIYMYVTLPCADGHFIAPFISVACKERCSKMNWLASKKTRKSPIAKNGNTHWTARALHLYGDM